MSFAQAATTVGVDALNSYFLVSLLNGIAQGTADSQRIGSKIVLRRSRINITLQGNALDTTSRNYYGIMRLVRFPMGFEGALGASPQNLYLNYSMTQYGYMDALRPFLDSDSIHTLRCRIVKTKRFHLYPNSHLGSIQYTKPSVWNTTFDINFRRKEMVYDRNNAAGTLAAGQMTKNYYAIHVLIYSDNTAAMRANPPVMICNAVSYFQDG